MSSNITAQPEQHKTADGFKFDSWDQARCHQECLEAIEAFEQAQQKLFAAVAAKHYITADGKPFGLDYSSYWIVVEPIYEPPYATAAEIKWYSSQTTYFFNERTQMLNIKWKRGDKEFERPVTEFFTSELAAREFALRRRQQHVDWWLEDLKMEEAKLKKITGGIEK